MVVVVVVVVKGKITRKERNEKVQVRACAHACVRACA